MKKISSLVFPFVVATLLFPLPAFAQSIEAIMDKVLGWLDILFPLLGSLAIVYFFFGIVRFLGRAGDDKSREEGKGIMVWGMIALFVMVALWGLVGYLQTTLGLDTAGGPGDAPHTPLGPLPTFD
jgi:hypothetical protein